MLRDSIVYLTSFGVLIAVLVDGTVMWQGALLMLVLYGVYILVLTQNQPLQRLFCPLRDLAGSNTAFAALEKE